MKKAREQNFEIAGYVIDASSEPVRAPRVVRVGLIQNKIVLPTTDPVLKQVGCDFDLYSEVYFFIHWLHHHLAWLKLAQSITAAPICSCYRCFVVCVCLHNHELYKNG